MRAFPMNNPFLALRSYSADDAKRVGFHGRDADIVLIQSRLYSARTTLLFAGSGVGKTSLIDARLAPLLEKQRWSVVIHRLWATEPPLDALRAAIAATGPGAGLEALSPFEQLERRARLEGAPAQILLILDQFEEVFQHWRDSTALDRFAQEVAHIAHASTLDARVLFSMREEFLGELSLFDNLIPDLFSNCYRLKNPTRAEAEEIIEKTAYAEQQVECGESGLQALLEDLLAAPRPATMAGVDLTPSARSRIPMPFLQIVCHRLWDQQMGRKRATVAWFPQRFLEAHVIGQAPAELDAYCREKLDALDDEQRDIATAAFAFLMTPGGAKMAYPVDVLAAQAVVDEAALLNVLRTLSAPNVRILREIAGGHGGKPWFELYHDLYAKFLSEWKRTHDARRAEEKAQRQEEDQERQTLAKVQQAVAAEARRQQRYLRLVGAVPILFLLGFFLWDLRSDYVSHYKPLREFALQASMTPTADAYLAARSSREALRATVFASWAQQWWAHYWSQRAQREMLNGRVDEAVLSLTRSLADEETDVHRRQLSDWLSYGETVRVFRAPEPIVSFGFLQSTDGVFAELSDCTILIWKRATGALVRTISGGPAMPECAEIMALSTSGSHVVYRTRDGASVRHVDSGKDIWTGEGFVSYASLSTDDRWAVVDLGGIETLVALGSGMSRSLAPPVKDPSSRPYARYLYSPFTPNLIAVSADGIKVLSPDGMRTLQTLTFVEAFPDHPELQKLSFDVMPLAGDRLALIGYTDIALIGGSQPTTVVRRPEAFPATQVSSELLSSPDGRHILLWAKEAGVCRISPDRASCDHLSFWVAGNSKFVAASLDTALLQPDSASEIREVRLSPLIAPAYDASVTSARVGHLAPGGRWMITNDEEPGRKACRLWDLAGTSGQRVILEDCASVGFQFSASGAAFFRQHDTRSPGRPPVRSLDVYRSESLDRTSLDDASFVTWASDDHLVFRRSDDSQGILHVPSGAVQSFTFKPEALSAIGCGSLLDDVIISPDGRHAAVRERIEVALYQREGDGWGSRRPLPNSEQACSLAFSPDSSRLLMVLNNNFLTLVNAHDGEPVGNLNDRLRPVHEPVFAAGPVPLHSMSMGSDSSDLVAWRIGMEQPVWRAPVPAGMRFLSRPGAQHVAVASESILAWLQSGADTDLTLRVRRMPNANTPQIEAAPDGTIRFVATLFDGALGAWNVAPDFADVPPFQLGPETTWESAYEQWVSRLDIQMNDATGRYEPVTTPAPLRPSPPSPAQKPTP